MRSWLIGVVCTTLAAPVPKTWNANALAWLELPRAGLRKPPVHISPDFYYRIPVMRIYSRR